MENISVFVRSFPEFSFEITLKMRLVSDADLYLDFLNVQMRGFQKFARLLQPKIIDVLDKTRLSFFFEQMPETRDRQINRRRQITDDQFPGNIVFDCFEYLLNSVIHPRLQSKRKEPPKLQKPRGDFLFAIGHDFLWQNLSKNFLARKDGVEMTAVIFDEMVFLLKSINQTNFQTLKTGII